jgi:hypothetical protein
MDEFYTFIYCTMHDEGCVIKGNHAYVPDGYSMQHSTECKWCDWTTMGIIQYDNDNDKDNFEIIQTVRINYDKYCGGFMFRFYTDTLTDEKGNSLENKVLDKWIEEIAVNEKENICVH